MVVLPCCETRAEESLKLSHSRRAAPARLVFIYLSHDDCPATIVFRLTRIIGRENVLIDQNLAEICLAYIGSNAAIFSGAYHFSALKTASQRENIQKISKIEKLRGKGRPFPYGECSFRWIDWPCQEMIFSLPHLSSRGANATWRSQL